MASITTRVGKGSPLTTQELDANFTNLNADKVETSVLSGLIKVTGAFGFQFDAGRDASLFHANSGYHTLMAH